MKKETRIVKRTFPDHQDTYVIQQKHWLFKWRWVDAWLNSVDGASCRDYFDTLEEAQKNLKYFDGTQAKEEVVHE